MARSVLTEPSPSGMVTRQRDQMELQRNVEDHEGRITAGDALQPSVAGVPEALKNVVPDAANLITGLAALWPTQARTATPTGATTGTIAAHGNQVVVVTPSADANDIIILPPPVLGTILVIHGGPTTGYELRSSSPTTIAINGGTGSNAESAIAADSTIILICVTTTAWKGFFMDADGDLAKVEAAA